MPKSIVVLLLALIGGGGMLLKHYRVEGLEKVVLSPRDGQPTDIGPAGEDGPPVARDGDSIRIASFNIQVFGDSKAAKPNVMNVLAEVVRQFDIVAVQEIRTKNESLLPQFVQLINGADRQYAYAIGPRLGRTTSKEQYAYIYDTASIEMDRASMYTVQDLSDRLHREPLVGWFRVRGPAANEAFTFKLVNIHTDPDETDTELNALDDVFRAVRNDGSNEDDIILLGDLNVDDSHLGELGQIPGIAWTVPGGTPTYTRLNKSYDNIVFQAAATREYTGRWGVFNLMQAFNLTTEQALEVSDHLPIWAEFSLYEGGQPGRVARQGAPLPR